VRHRDASSVRIDAAVSVRGGVKGYRSVDDAPNPEDRPAVLAVQPPPVSRTAASGTACADLHHRKATERSNSVSIARRVDMASSNGVARQERRKQVIDAAVMVFSEQGYRATSMHDLAAAVGLSKPSLYHYVSSKEDLLVELYENVIAEGIESARRIGTRSLPPLEATREIVIERIVYTCENRKLLRIFFEEEAEIPAELTQTVRQQKREYEDLIISLLKRGVEDGSVRLSTTPRIAVNTLLGAAHWVYKWYDPGGSKSARALAKDVTNLLLTGLDARAGETSPVT
jgi:AcrR family transcriptional regulator